MTPDMPKIQWERVKAECDYESSKAVAAAHWKQDTSSTRLAIYIQCVELKGATHLGKVTMPTDTLDRILIHCKQEAVAAVAGQPASKGRHQQQEEAEVACMKREGVTFDPTPW